MIHQDSETHVTPAKEATNPKEGSVWGGIFATLGVFFLMFIILDTQDATIKQQAELQELRQRIEKLESLRP